MKAPARPDGFADADLAPLIAAAGNGPVLLGLSGGGDSASLLHLLAAALPGRVRACVVDHAVRPGSAAEAAQAADAAREAGVPAAVTRLAWALDARPSQAALRQGRHRALYAAARAEGASIVALAHTADDQAETVLMRAARPECPWRALGAMAALSPAALWPEGEGLAIARPLLGVRRAALRRWLRRRGHRWIDDPSNANLAFERVRARAALAALEGAGLDPMRLVAAAARVRRAAGAIDRAAGAWLARSAKIEGAVAWLPREIRPGAARARAVWALMAAVGGGAGPPPRPLARLMDRLARPGFRGATLAGCRLSLRGSALELSRDPGALLGRNGAPGLAPLLLRAGGSAVWDGRARIASPAGATVTADHAVAGAPRIAPEGAAAVEWLIHARIRHALGAAAYCSGM